MKKIIVFLSLVLLVGFIGTFAYAQGLVPNQNGKDSWVKWHEDRLEWKRSQVDEALEEGFITEKEAKYWNEHFNYMEEFHRGNKFINGVGCHGYGLHRGMMRRNGW